MKKKRDALDKLFVNCNKLEEDKAKRLINNGKDLSIKSWKWDVPYDLQKLSKVDCYRFDTFIGLGRWNVSKSKGSKFIVIAKRGELIYLEPEIIKVLYNSIKEDSDDK